MQEKLFHLQQATMIKLDSITIENFQSHERTVLDLSHGLNVITGPSDNGKSAIIRAIKWALYNEPRGTEFIRHGSPFARVSLKFDNGVTIVRERSQSKNRYSVIDKEGNSTVFEGFGNGIPSEILNAHGISKVFLDADNSTCLNIGEQLEGPFLLSESGATRAKALGRLIGLHVIDKSIKDCVLDQRRESQNTDRLKHELEAVTSNLVNFEALEQLKGNIDNVESILADLSDKTVRHEMMTALKNSLNKQIRDDETLLSHSKSTEPLEEVLSKIESASLRLKDLQALKSSMDTNDLNIKEGVAFLNQNALNMQHFLEDYTRLLKAEEKCPWCLSEIDNDKVKSIISYYKESC